MKKRKSPKKIVVRPPKAPSLLKSKDLKGSGAKNKTPKAAISKDTELEAAVYAAMKTESRPRNKVLAK